MTRNDKITITIHSSRGAEFPVSFPAKWIICPQCDGCATDHGASVECDGGGFTASEWNEQDEDFREDYMAGRYDRPCEPCDGLGRIQIVDEEAVTGWRETIFLRALDRQQEADADYAALCAAERRMGA